jgi:hypothetical protein
MEQKLGSTLITKNILHAGTKSVTFTTGTKVGYCRISSSDKIGKVGIYIMYITHAIYIMYITHAMNPLSRCDSSWLHVLHALTVF